MYESDSNSELSTYPLKRYLHTVWLPTFRATAAPLLDAAGRTQAWPVYEDLRRRSGTRRLTGTTRLDLAQLRHETTNYFDALPDVLLDCASAAPALMLPNPDLLQIESADLRYLTRIDDGGKFRQLVEKYVLDTLSEALRLVHHLAPDVPLAQALRFRETPQFCSIWQSKWDVLYLPGSVPGTLSMAVVCLPPWDFGFADFEDFVRPQQFREGHLDTLDTTPYHQPSYKLWAALYDVCAGRGLHFAVTTYDRWAFGRFNDDWSSAQLTQVVKSPIRDFEGRALYRNPGGVQGAGPNLMEVVMFWIQAARGAAVAGELRTQD